MCAMCLIAQLCPTLRDPMDCSPPGFSVHAILQARILEWIAILLSMKFSMQEYWCGYSFPSPGDLLNSGLEPGSPALQADSLPSKLPGKS